MHDGDSRSAQAVLALRIGNIVLRQEKESTLCPQLDSVRGVPQNKDQPGHHSTYRLSGICVLRKQENTGDLSSKGNLLGLSE